MDNKDEEIARLEALIEKMKVKHDKKHVLYQRLQRSIASRVEIWNEKLSELQKTNKKYKKALKKVQMVIKESAEDYAKEIVASLKKELSNANTELSNVKKELSKEKAFSDDYNNKHNDELVKLRKENALLKNLTR